MPKELEEASYLDGCGAYRTFIKIMLPASLSIMVTVFLLSLSWQWTDTTFSPLFLRDTEEFRILTTMVSQLGSREGTPIMISNYLNTGSILAILPLALIYIIAQKFFVQSIDRAGIVG
jgi:multiple sugar transport system permease protein